VAVAIRLGEYEIARGNVDGAKPTGEPARLGAWRIDMAGGYAVPKFGYWINAISRMAPKTEENIVMTIENELHFSSWAGSTEQIGSHSIKRLRGFAIPKIKKFAYE
jgi:hypothetical protein